jgi:hypothetical protein
LILGTLVLGLSGKAYQKKIEVKNEESQST